MCDICSGKDLFLDVAALVSAGVLSKEEAHDLVLPPTPPVPVVAPEVAPVVEPAPVEDAPVEVVEAPLPSELDPKVLANLA